MGVVNFDKAGDIGVSLRPKRIDIELYRGDSFKFFFELEGPAPEGGGPRPPINITGWTGRSEVKDSGNLVVDTPIVTIDGDPLEGRIKVDFGTTEDIEPGEYRYDVEMTDSGGNVRTFVGGKFVVTEDVTD